MEFSVYILFPIAIFTIYVAKFIGKLVTRRNTKIIAGKHVVVTGACSGIGKSAAILAIQKGANVTLIGGNMESLVRVREQMLQECIKEDQIIMVVSVNTFNQEDIDTVLDTLEEKIGPIYMLINCEELAVCGEVETFSEDDLEILIKANYLGALYPIQNVIPKFKRRKEGIIVLTGSHLSLMGMFGYAIYSSCKFALRGLAESIYLELKPYNVSVTLSLPVDTNTPCYEVVIKSRKAMLFYQLSHLVQQEATAKQLLDDALVGKFFSCVGWKCYLLTAISVGTLSVLNLREVFAEWFEKARKIIHQYYRREGLEN